MENHRPKDVVLFPQEILRAGLAVASSFCLHLIGGKKSACSAGDSSLIPGSGRPSGEGNGYPLQYSCLENSMDTGAWQAIVCGSIARAELDTTEWPILSLWIGQNPFSVRLGNLLLCIQEEWLEHVALSLSWETTLKSRTLHSLDRRDSSGFSAVIILARKTCDVIATIQWFLLVLSINNVWESVLFEECSI